MSRPCHRNQNGSEYKLEALEPRVMLSADPVSCTAGEFDAALTEDSVRLEESGRAPSAFNDAISYTTPSGNLFDFGADGGSPTPAAAGDDQPAPATAPVQEHEDDAAAHASEQVVLQVVEEPAAKDQMAVFAVAVLAPVSTPDILNSVAAQLTETLRSANGPPAQDVVGENVGVDAIASEVTSARGAYSEAAGYSQFGNPPEVGDSALSSLPISGSPVGSVDNSPVGEIVFIDRSLPDYEVLLQGVLATASANGSRQVFLLEPERDGIEQITEILAGQQGITAVHILSHGSAASLALGSARLTAANLEQYTSQLSSWATALTAEADLLLYGCNVAAGEAGAAFVQRLGEITGADVAASTDVTGSGALGGDWVLEAPTGPVDAPSLAIGVYGFALADIVGTDGNDKLVSNKAVDDILTGKKGDDTYVFQNYWGQDRVVERADEGTDTIDLSAVTDDITIALTAGGAIQPIHGIGPNSVSGVAGLDIVNFEIVKAGKGENTLDLSNYADPLTVFIRGSVWTRANEVIVKAGQSTLLTVRNVTNIVGSPGDDTFIIGKNGTLKGYIDGGGGIDTLSYEEYASNVAVDLSTDAVTQPTGQSGFKRATNITKGVKNIRNLKGGTGRNTLIGDGANNILTGGPDVDMLEGRGGDDTLYGLAEGDTLNGGSGSDQLYGGKGNDRYVFQDDWGQDTVVEKIGEGTDTFDFSVVTRTIIAAFDQAGPQVTEGANTVRKLEAETTIKIEMMIGSTGASNEYRFLDGFATNFTIDDNKPDPAQRTATLDFSGISHDLTVTLESRDKLTAAFKSAAVAPVSQIIAKRIANLTGGQGNNTYLFKNGGQLLGNLAGGSPNQPAGKINLLDYSNFGAPVWANLTDTSINFDTELYSNALPSQPQPPQLPVQEQWQYLVLGLKGSITFEPDADPSEAFAFETTKSERAGLDAQLFKKGLATLLGRNDFTVSRNEKRLDGGTAATLWTITFAEPKVLGINLSDFEATVKLDGSQATLQVAPTQTAAGRPAVDQTWELYTKATGGRLQLELRFKDLGFEAIVASTSDIHWNDAPNQIQKTIQEAINTEIANADLDVAPKVLVSGMGTQTFPWRITFANMGAVSVAEKLVALTANFPSGCPLPDKNLPESWASGFQPGKVVTGINKVIGSAEDDRIYGSDELTPPIRKISPQEMAFPDSYTLKLADAGISLQTGQAVLYRVVGEGTAIKGLTSDTIYFVKVTKVIEGSDAGTKITFYPTAERDVPIRLYPPIGDGEHQLLPVFQAEGGKGDDILVGYVADRNGPPGPLASGYGNALLGGEGEDVLVGSNGSDYLDGGPDNDSIYGDGSHDDTGADDDAPDQGRDTVRGGPGIDSIYGYTGPDHLVGGLEGDFLVGGAGGDRVEGQDGNDTLAVVERGNVAKDYDLLFGGDGNDLYLFKGEWGVASLGESARGGSDTIDLSASSQNYVYILSNGNLFAVPGILYNGADSSVIQVAGTHGGSIRLGTALEELTGSKPSPGDVLTQWGFGFHQSVVGDADAVLTAYASPVLPAGPLSGWLWVDRGDGPKVYDASIDTASWTAEELRDKLQAKLGSDLLVTLVGGTLLNKPKLQILATPSGARDEHGNIIPAKMEFTVKAPNSVAVGGEGNFENFEQINVSSGANTFVFGNDYWGGGNPAWAALQLLPIGDVIGRSVQGKLTVNTKDLHANGAPLTLDFRAVNYELYFTFSPIKGDESAVQLTVRSVCDLEIPIVGLGANIRYNTIVFTHVDKNAIIYGGRFKNTFNLDKSADYQGTLVGGKGTGVLTQFAGRLTDQVQIILKALQNGVLEASLPNFTSWDQFNLGSWDDLVRTFVFRVQNTLSYSNPGVGASTLGNLLNPKNLWTQVNLQRLKTQGAPRDAADWTIQAAQGNLFGPLIDTVWESTTGLSGLSENFKDVNPGEVIVRSGINLVRGRDYSWKDIKDWKNNPTALLTSGADIISIGDNFFSATPGLHILAGGSGADTYTIRSQWWGGALILDDLQLEVFDNAANELLEDTLDFSAYTQDLYFSTFKLTLSDIGAVKDVCRQFGLSELPLDVGASVVLVTPFKSEARGFAGFFQQYAGVPWYKWNFALAIGVENIKGGRGKNTFTFYDDARIGGKIDPGFGGSVVLDYAGYRGGINVNLASKPPTGPSILGLIPLPNWALNLFSFASKQPGAASGTAGLTQGQDVTGSAHDDIIEGNNENNNLVGGTGGDQIWGQGGDDQLSGDDGDDEIHGGGGSDLLYGGPGNDKLWGDEGNDRLWGGEGNDIINGGSGSDTYFPSSSADLVVLMGSSVTDLPPGVSSIISSLGAAFTTAERDALSSIETIEINSGVSLPQNALFITQDGVKQTININPENMALGTYHLYVDQEGTDMIDMKGYGASKVTFEPCSGEGSNTVQTLKIYKNSNKTAQDLILTLVIHGYGRAINERDLNFTPDKLLAGQFGTATTSLTQHELDNIANAAKSDWLSITSNKPDVETALNGLTFVIDDLSGLQLANLSGNTIMVDIDAARNGWFVDPTPGADDEFSQGVANSSSPAFGKYDLLTVLRHEIGHVLGLPHDNSTASALMDALLAPGTREAISAANATQINPGHPQPGDAEGTPSDQQKMLDGLDAFATWAESLGASLSASLAETVQLPFIETPLNNLWNATAGLIASRIGQSIRQDIVGVFQGDDEVTTDDFLALDSVGPAASHRLTEFEANIELTGTGTDLTFNLDFLKNLGLDLTSFLKLTQSEPLRLEVTLTLRFGFGLDGATGEFYIEDPSLVASITLKHNKPLDVSLSVGPLGIGIEDGTIFFQAGIMLPAEGRYGVGSFSEFDIGSPTFDPTSSYEVNLPFKLEGALAGLVDEVGRISGSFNRGENLGLNVENLTASQFFTMIPQTLNFDGPNFGALLDLTNVSLDQALEGIKTTLQKAIDPNGAAYQKLPFLNKSAVDLLGKGSVDVVQAVINGISVVQENLSDINHFEIDLNQALHQALGLAGIGGDEVGAAYDYLVSLSRSLTSQSTDDEIAVALAQKYHNATFESLKPDRDVAAAYARLMGLCQEANPTDLEIAEKLADRDIPGRLAGLKLDRNMVRDYDGGLFMEHWVRLIQYGFNSQTSDAEIEAFFDSTEAINLAIESRTVLDDPAATEDAKKAARTNLARLGIAEDATVDEINAALNRDAEIATAKADRNYVQENFNSSPALQDAALALQALGLDGNATDLALATALVGVAKLAPWQADRDLLLTYGADSIKGRLEALDAIVSASVTGLGTAANPWIVQFTLAPNASPDQIAFLGTNVHVTDPVLVNGTTATYRQQIYLDGTFNISFGTGAPLIIATANAGQDLKQKLEALAAIGAVRVTGAGTSASPWMIEYTSAAGALSDQILSPGSNVHLTGTLVANTTYQQAIALAEDFSGATFDIQFGTETLTISVAAAATELKQKLEALSAIGNVTVTGEGTVASPWSIQYTSRTGTLADQIKSGVVDVQVTAAMVAQATYRQGLYLDDTFNVRFGDETLTISIAGATAATPAEALSRLQAVDQSLAATSTDAEIARKLVSTAEFTEATEARDILAQYDAKKSIDLEYKDSVLDVRMSMAPPELTGSYDLAFDLKDLPGLGELLTSGDTFALELTTTGHLYVDLLAQFDLNFTWDLSSLGDPKFIIYDNSQITFKKLEIRTLDPIKITGSFLINGKPVLQLAINDATIDVNLAGSISLVEDAADHKYLISELASNLSLWNIDLLGTVNATLPMYFPTETTPFGGSAQDENGDGYADNLLHVDGVFRGKNDFNLNFVTPDFDLSLLSQLFALLNDPENLLKGLDGMFEGLKDGLNSQFATMVLPMAGDKLKEAAGFMDDLRDDLLGVVDDTKAITDLARYDGSGLGHMLAEAVALNHDTDPNNDVKVIDLLVDAVKTALFEKLGSVLKVPVTDPVTGQVQYDEMGRVVYRSVTSKDDIQLTISAKGIAFNVLFAGTIFETKVPLNFAAAIPGFELKSTGNIDLVLGYQFGLGFGFDCQAGLYVDTSGVTETGEELVLFLDVTIPANTELEATLFFLTAKLTSAADADRPSGLFGSFSVDLKDKNGDGKWTLFKPWGSGSSDGLDIVARFKAEADVDLNLNVSVGGGTAFPSLSTIVSYEQVFADVQFGTGGASRAEFGGVPVIEFRDVKVNLGEFITSFVSPIVDKVSQVTDKVKPVIDVLTKPIGLLEKLGASRTSLLDIAKWLLPDQAASIQRAVDAIKDVIALVDAVKGFRDAAASEGGPIEINLGTFTVGGDPRATDAHGRTQTSIGATTSKSDPKSQVTGTDAKADAARNLVSKFGTTKGSFQFLLLTDPKSAFGLLLGKEVELFKYDLPALNLDFKYEQSFPIFPGLNAFLGGQVTATTNFSFGFNTRGFNQWKAQWNEEAHYYAPDKLYLLFNGFYLDDHVTFAADGKTIVKDLPEVTLSASITAGAFVGVRGLVEAGVRGGVYATINFDLNDNPKAVPDTNPVPNSGHETAVGEYDGKMYGNEVLDRLKHGPQCLFDMSGKLTAGLEAYLWIGVKIWRWKITIFNKKFNLFTVVLADFDKACTVTTTGTGDQTHDPILAERAGDGTLTLNMGAERASYRIYGDTSDGNERFTIRQQDNKIFVTYEGFTNEFTGVTRIVANGGGGDDEIIIEDSVTADVELHGGVGNDTLRMNGSGKARLYGDDGNDVLIGGPNDDYLDGGEGDDTLEGGGGNDELHGGIGNDSLKGGNGDDKLYGEDGNDVLYGEQGNDELYGGDGQDQVDGGDGNDTIYGDDETGLVGDNDTVIGGDGNDIIYAGPGDDVVNAGAFVPAGKTYTGTGDNDTVYGGPGNDELRGGPGSDKLYGEDGDDVLFGDEGADEVYGGSGNDRLNGGSGADSLLGEEGNDVVEWDSADEADIIIDGGSSDGDVLLLVGADSGEAITIGSAGDGSHSVRVHMGGITFAVAGVEVVGVKAGTGQDSVTVNDLSQTAVREVNVGFGAGLQQTFVVKTQEQQKISVLGGSNGTFTLSFGGQTTRPISVNATAAQVTDALTELETLTLRDEHGQVLDRYFEVAPAGGGETGWIVTFTGPLAGQDVQELLANWAAFATAGTIRDGGPANEVQKVTVTNATAGTFVLHYGDQETSPIAYNADAASVQAALEALASIGEGNVIVTRLAADWRLELVKDLAARDIAALTVDGSSLEGAGATASVETLLEGGTIQDEAQTITIGNPASGAFRLFYAGEATGEIPYNTSTETLRAELEKLSGIGSGNVAVTSSGGGTYTVVFQGGLAGTNVAQLIVTDSSLSTLASPAGAVIVTTLAQGAFETEENGDKKIETITGPDTSSDTLIISGSGNDDRFEIVVAKDANGADVLSVVQRQGVVLNVTFSISQMSDAKLDKLSIQGLGGNDTFDLSGLTELPVVLEIVGGTGNDTMVGPALNNTWTLAENNQGSLANANYALTFSSIEAITGGHSADTLAGPNTINTWTLNGNNSGNLNDALTFSSIETIKGGSTGDTLVGPAGTNVWTLTQDNAGNLNSALTFSSIETITGGTGFDILLGLTRTNVWTLTETNAGNLNGLLAFSSIEEIVGGAETDTVLGPNVTNTWKLSGNNAGILNEALTFSSIEVITGGSGVDTLIGPAINNLWRLTQNNAGDLNNHALKFSSIEVITGGTATDTLLGPDTANTWTLTGRNAGDLNGALAFSQIENLVGGSGNDKFVFADGAVVDGTINGGGGINQLDYSAYTTSVVVDLQTGMATGTAGIRNIRDVRGGKADDLIAGDDQNNVIEGMAGNDVLVGRGGSDTILGGSGEDVLVGDNCSEGSLGSYAQPLSYNVEYSETLVTWLPLATVTASGGTSSYVDAGARGVGRFYRVVLSTRPTETIPVMMDVLPDGSVRLTWQNPANPPSPQLTGTGDNLGDVLDGGEGRDLIFGDSVSLVGSTSGGGQADPRFRLLTGASIYGTDGSPLVASAWQTRPGGGPVWSGLRITLLDGAAVPGAANANSSINDYIAGGPGDDMIFGQQGDDIIQGDGSVDLSLTGNAPLGAYRDSSNLLHVNPSFEAATDGDDYIEGGPGNDVIFGNLGPDDIIGGSSSLFGLTAPGQRPDGSDLIFGGAGTDISRNNPGDTLDSLDDPNSTGVHGRDSDAIVGDNGNIYRLVGTAGYLTFNYDDYDPVVKIVPRAIELLDYTPGGSGYDPVRAAADIGAADEIHGESGDDFIYGMKGNDVLFGDGQDDDLIGGYGNDWISGGTGDDGVLGDDGRIFTSRNTASYDEPLYGIPALSATNTTISVPGKILFTTINLNGQLKKTADLEPFYETNSVLPAQYPAGLKDDVIYGGLGNDFLHGQEGDDAISGAEALPEFFNAPINNGNVLNFGGFGVAKGYRDPAEFADYDQYNPIKEIAGFLLNFETTVNGVKVDDGKDALFGDTGNDWLVGGTNSDFLFGGWGSDLLDADDHKGTAGGLNNVPDALAFADPDIAYGGAGRDVLIANTGGDRLIDWVGQFNTHLVPITSFGAPTVIRAIQPQLPEYLCALARSLGADQTRVSPGYGTGAGYGEAARYGEPYGELGLVTQHDKGFWKDQVGGADGLLAGTVLGTQRDVRFAETFTPGSLEAFAPTTGTWKSANGVYLASPGRGVEAVSLMLYADYLPSYAEVLATVNGNQSKAGFKSNAYIVFDYQDATNFKFAGIDVGLNKLRIGQHTAEGWTYLTQSNMILSSATNYGLKLVLNANAATLIVNGVKALNYTFDAPLDGGMLGLGTDNATSRFDDVQLLVLPPSVTQSVTEDFSGDTTGAFNQVLGAWAVAGGTYQAGPELGSDAAISTLSSSLLAGTGSQLLVTVSTQSFGGVVFDYQDPLNFKFAGIMTGTNQVIIGHRTVTGWYFDEVITRTIKAGAAYNLGVSIQGSTVSVSLNGERVASHTYAGSFLEDGNAGLFSLKGSTVFDDASMSATLL